MQEKSHQCAVELPQVVDHQLNLLNLSLNTQKCSLNSNKSKTRQIHRSRSRQASLLSQGRLQSRKAHIHPYLSLPQSLWCLEEPINLTDSNQLLTIRCLRKVVLQPSTRCSLRLSSQISCPRQMTWWASRTWAYANSPFTFHKLPKEDQITALVIWFILNTQSAETIFLRCEEEWEC